MKLFLWISAVVIGIPLVWILVISLAEAWKAMIIDTYRAWRQWREWRQWRRARKTYCK